MIKLIAVAVVLSLAVPAQAQMLGDLVVSQYIDFMKAKAAVKACTSEEGRMQLERNAHYDTLLQANAKDPAAPTIDEMSQVLTQVRSEDAALSQKRDECEPLFDQLSAAVRALRRDCAAYGAPSAGDEPTGTDKLAVDVCHGPKSADAGKPKNP
jgi:hypothetical protein